MEEREFKYMLSENQFNNLKKLLSSNLSPKTFIQVNYYFDTQERLLNKSDITLRVRQKESDLQLQIKCPVFKDEALVVKNELTKEIWGLPSYIQFKKFEWTDLLPKVEGAYLIGSLVTERTKYNLNEMVEVDIDKNLYLGIVDYELEIEFAEGSLDKSKSLIDEILRTESIRPSNKSKRARFFEKLQEIF